MGMFSRPIEPCIRCEADNEFNALKKVLQIISKEIKDKWIASRVVNMVGIGSIDKTEEEEPTHEVLMSDETATVIPSFRYYHNLWKRQVPTEAEYTEMWKSVMLNSPFDVDWEKLNMHDQWDRDYLVNASDIIDEQCDIWRGDVFTKHHPVFHLVNTFSYHLNALITLMGRRGVLFHSKHKRLNFDIPSDMEEAKTYRGVPVLPVEAFLRSTPYEEITKFY